MNIVKTIGSKVIYHLKNMFYAAGFFFETLKETLLFIRNRHVGSKVLTMQILFTGVNALSIIGIIALALGAVIMVEGIEILQKFGQGNLMYTILVTVITRELGPLLTAFIITARSGTAIATELGNMVVSHEVEAYVATGINPISYLVVPRFLGVTISVVFLNLYFNLFGLFGSFFLNLLINPIPFVDYSRSLLSVLSFNDIVSSVLKSLIFGAIISTVATYQGLKVKTSTTEIPQVVIKAVGQGFVLCILADALITVMYYAQG